MKLINIMANPKYIFQNPTTEHEYVHISNLQICIKHQGFLKPRKLLKTTPK